jgi:hypothetical protein
MARNVTMVLTSVANRKEQLTFVCACTAAGITTTLAWTLLNSGVALSE